MSWEAADELLNVALGVVPSLSDARVSAVPEMAMVMHRISTADAHIIICGINLLFPMWIVAA